MASSDSESRVLRTTAGDWPLYECRIRVGDRDWSVWHTAAVVTHDDEARFMKELADWMPYGVALWPAALALAHEVATRPDEFRGRRVLELGAGTGLPGVIAASFGAKVVQTDRHELAIAVCRRNGERNGVTGVEYRLADWSAWDDTGRYDWIIGSDILYAEPWHAALRQIFERNLADGGRVLLADPFRTGSLGVLEALEAAGWRIAMTKWALGEPKPRPVGVYELTPSLR